MRLTTYHHHRLTRICSVFPCALHYIGFYHYFGTIWLWENERTIAQKKQGSSSHIPWSSRVRLHQKLELLPRKRNSIQPEQHLYNFWPPPIFNHVVNLPLCARHSRIAPLYKCCWAEAISWKFKRSATTWVRFHPPLIILVFKSLKLPFELSSSAISAMTSEIVWIFRLIYLFIHLKQC